MLTPDDVRSVPLFSMLSLAELERLAETSADLVGEGNMAMAFVHKFLQHEGVA